MAKIKIGFIGCGSWARKKYLTYLADRDDVEITSFSNLEYPEEKRQISAIAPHCKTYATAEEMLSQEHLDGVIISLPHSLIASHLKMVLQRGIPAIADKPFTVGAKEAESVIATAEKHNTVVAVCHQRRDFPGTAKTKKLLDSGLRPSLRWLSTTFYLHSYPNWLHAWRNNPEFSGQPKLKQGILLDTGYHHIDSVLYLLNFMQPTMVECVGSYRDAQVETDITAILEFPNEVRATFQISRNFPEQYELESMMVLGDDWLIDSSITKTLHTTDVRFRRYQHETLVEETNETDLGGVAQEPMKAFIEHLQGHKLPEIWNAKNSVLTMKVIDALYSSLLSKSRVSL